MVKQSPNWATVLPESGFFRTDECLETIHIKQVTNRDSDPTETKPAKFSGNVLKGEKMFVRFISGSFLQLKNSICFVLIFHASTGYDKKQQNKIVLNIYLPNNKVSWTVRTEEPSKF